MVGAGLVATHSSAPELLGAGPRVRGAARLSAAPAAVMPAAWDECGGGARVRGGLREVLVTLVTAPDPASPVGRACRLSLALFFRKGGDECTS